MEEITSIPQDAWMQAVFVCLFIVLIVVLLNWFAKQQDKWQIFIDKQNSEWRCWMDAAETRTAAQMKDVTATLKSLADKLDRHDYRVMNKLDDHDDKVDDRINKMNNKKD